MNIDFQQAQQSSFSWQERRNGSARGIPSVSVSSKKSGERRLRSFPPQLPCPLARCEQRENRHPIEARATDTSFYVTKRRFTSRFFPPPMVGSERIRPRKAVVVRRRLLQFSSRQRELGRGRPPLSTSESGFQFRFIFPSFRGFAVCDLRTAMCQSL